jgi:hypothetical protein
MSAAPAGFRPRVDGRSTTAGVRRAAAGRRPGGRSPRSGLWRAGSVSRRNTRPSRRTGTAAARSTCRRGGDRSDTRWTRVRCRGCRPRACTGVGLRSVLGRGRLVASRSSLGSVRVHLVLHREHAAGQLGKSQHVHCSSPALMSGSIVRLRNSSDRGYHVWSFDNCATSSPSPKSCISAAPRLASTSSSPR